MKSLIRFLVYSNIWVAICVVALAISSELLLGSENCQISLFLFFSTVFIYNFQRIVKIKKGVSHERKEWFLRHKKLVYTLMILCLSFSGYYFYFFKFYTKIAICSIGILSFLYPFGLRKIPFLKILVISMVWTIGTMLLLVLENHLLISENTIFNLCARFLFVFAITIPFDIRDVKYDLGKVKTFPLFFGVRKSQYLAFSALTICAVISVYQYLENILFSPHLLALILLYFAAAIFVANSNQERDYLYFSFLGESLSICAYLFLGIMLLIF